MSLFAAAADFAALATGGPALLLVGDVEAPALPGIACWRATPVAGDWALHRDGAAAALVIRPAAPALHVLPAAPAFEVLPAAPAFEVLPAPPAGVLAILAADAAAVATLAAAWGPSPPPLLGAAAGVPWQALATLAMTALGDRAAAAGDLHAALAAAREAAEETRFAMAALIAGTGRHAPPPPPVLALEHAPAGAEVWRPDAGGRLVAGVTTGVSLQGLAAVALHVAVAGIGAGAGPEPETGNGVAAGTVLRLRLFGAESRRLHGAWSVPGAGLAPGWCVFDLPAALGPIRETACLDVAAAVAPGDALALSATASGPPALRLWTAPFGRRYAVVPHWDAGAVGLELPPPGVPVTLPEAIWEALPGGPALGDEPARPLVALATGAAQMLVLPAVPLAGLDRIVARLGVPLGEAAAVEAALWLQPAGVAPADMAALSLRDGVARWSAWRRGAPGAATIEVPLMLPPALPPNVAVVLTLRLREGMVGEAAIGDVAGGQAPGGARVRWDALLGFRDTPVAPASDSASARSGRPVPAPLDVAARPDGATASVAGAALAERHVSADGAYRHLDLRLERLRFGGLEWAAVRCKLAIGGAAPHLEFRLRPDWPHPFERWPGTLADAHGPYWHADAAALAGDDLAWRDRQLLLALWQVLPSVVATAAREAAVDLDEYRDWGELARRLAAG